MRQVQTSFWPNVFEFLVDARRNFVEDAISQSNRVANVALHQFNLATEHLGVAPSPTTPLPRSYRRPSAWTERPSDAAKILNFEPITTQRRAQPMRNSDGYVLGS
jgi:hypothetical protein